MIERKIITASWIPNFEENLNHATYKIKLLNYFLSIYNSLILFVFYKEGYYSVNLKQNMN